MTQEEKNKRLLRASITNNVGNVKKLLASNADPNQIVDNDYPLNAACRYDNEKIVKLLLNAEANVNVKDKYGETPLISAIITHSTEIVKDLLEHGADPNTETRHGYALTLAILNDYSEITAILLDMGTDVNKQDKKGWTPLMYAAKNGMERPMDTLIKAGADIEIRNHLGRTALDILKDRHPNKHMKLIQKIKKEILEKEDMSEMDQVGLEPDFSI